MRAGPPTHLGLQRLGPLVLSPPAAAAATTTSASIGGGREGLYGLEQT